MFLKTGDTGFVHCTGFVTENERHFSYSHKTMKSPNSSEMLKIGINGESKLLY